MSIATELTSLTGNIVNAYQACTSKGATIPANKNMNNLASCINSIPTDGGGGGPTGTGDYLIEFIDYDGTLLKSEYHDTGDVVTLPAGPTNHPRLVFQEWSSPVQITNNTITVTDHDIIIGAVYGTVSGKTEIDIELTEDTGLTVTCYALKPPSATSAQATRDWGDGSPEDDSPTHTYANYGKYTIKTDMRCFGGQPTANTYGAFDNNSEYKYNTYVKKIFIGNEATYVCDGYELRGCAELEEITLPKALVEIMRYSSRTAVFRWCYRLKCLVLPPNVKTIGSNFAEDAYSLKYIVIPFGVTSLAVNDTCSHCESLEKIIIPSTVSFSTGSNALTYCTSLKEAIILGTPYVSGMTGFFSSCHLLEKVKINLSTYLPTSLFSTCKKIRHFQIPTSVTSLGTNAFQYSGILNLTLHSGITAIPNAFCSMCSSLRDVICMGDIQSIGTTAFQQCNNLRTLDLSHCTTVPTLAASSNVFPSATSTISDYQILVPSALYEDWKVATNWSTYASRLVAV